MADAGMPATPPPSPNGADWPTQAADTIERVIGGVRDKTTEPAITAARAVVYGTFALLLGVAVFVLLTIALVRLLNNYLPDAVFGESHMWAAYLIIGVLFLIIAAFLWMRRRGGAEEAQPL